MSNIESRKKIISKILGVKNESTNELLLFKTLLSSIKALNKKLEIERSSDLRTAIMKISKDGGEFSFRRLQEFSLLVKLAKAVSKTPNKNNFSTVEAIYTVCEDYLNERER
ncbi:MAG: hypothetical protein JJV93_02505 [Alphaproteobacteria bacterium]|nr:hypothetical protein [Alphaproteobacteria bacterium]MBL0718103.1 hypothetical protein [Alphaproteobacteria bacterium]